MKLAITARLPVDVAARTAGLTVVQGSSGRMSMDEVVACDPDALVCLLTDRIDAAVMDRTPHLQVIANVAVGLDNIDIAAASERGICVTNTPEVLTEATAECAIALLFAVARRLGEGERLLRAGRWQGWAPDLLLGLPIAGTTLGVVGMGRIGQRVARLGQALGMTVCYATPRALAADSVLGATHLDLSTLLSSADFVSLHCPLRPDTRDLLDRSALSRMKPTAVLINTARGELVDEDALCDQLEAGRLFGAGLDVYRNEPRVSPRLLACERVTLAPHLGSATTTARTLMAELAIDAAVSVMRGQRPRTLINEAAWPPRRCP